MAFHNSDSFCKDPVFQILSAGNPAVEVKSAKDYISSFLPTRGFWILSVNLYTCQGLVYYSDQCPLRIRQINRSLWSYSLSFISQIDLSLRYTALERRAFEVSNSKFSGSYSMPHPMMQVSLNFPNLEDVMLFYHNITLNETE